MSISFKPCELCNFGAVSVLPGSPPVLTKQMADSTEFCPTADCDRSGNEFSSNPQYLAMKQLTPNFIQHLQGETQNLLNGLSSTTEDENCDDSAMLQA